MQITMLETHAGCEDGFNVRSFQKNVSYDMADMLACEFIRLGWAVESKYANQKEAI